jgi:ATP-dependent RNA helicase DeaD
MEVLNNVQLEGRRINVFLMVKVITTEEVLVVVVLVAEEVLPRREGSFAPRREGSGGRSDRNSGPRKVDLVEEALLQEGGFGGRSSAQEVKVLQTDQDVLKVLVTHLDQEDQEETNIYC